MTPTHRPRKELKPGRLSGIGEELMAQHWELYEGYVENVNRLEERIATLTSEGDFGVEFAGLKRQLGFEHDGMVLHERYFGALKPGMETPGFGDALTELMRDAFGGFPKWKDEYKAVGLMRGAGWAILYYDPRSRSLANRVIGSHEIGHPAGAVPLLVMDVWEHAYILDRGASGRSGYISAFLDNVDWRGVERSLRDAMTPLAAVER